MIIPLNVSSGAKCMRDTFSVGLQVPNPVFSFFLEPELLETSPQDLKVVWSGLFTAAVHHLGRRGGLLIARPQCVQTYHMYMPV